MMTPQEFLQKMSLPYEAKVNHFILKAREFYDRMQGNVYASIGGLDSITMLTVLRREVAKDIPGVSVSCLEDKSITAVHRTFDNFEFLQPLKNMTQVIKECGYPVISKDKAMKIQAIQNPTDRNAVLRHAIMTGQKGDGTLQKRMKLPKKWLYLFAGLENEKYGTEYKCANFKVSPDCCYWQKERPLEIYSQRTGRKPYMGLMASEGGRRQFALMKRGCNYYGGTIRSAPLAPFYQHELLRLALEYKAPVPAIYGSIERRPDGMLYTTKAQRTGCVMCGFGIHLEQRPHRFDRLRQDNYREWKFWMYDMGWGKVLDYIGVKWEDEYIVYDKTQVNLFECA